MDHTEDLSARVLLKNILSTEPPRTPITRSTSKVQSTSGSRRSNRLGKRDAGAQTPQDILRRSLKHKMRESVTRKSLPTTTRRTTSAVLRKINTPASASVLFDDGDTPRHILRHILRTEPVKSPVIHEKAGSEEPQLPSANSSITSKRPSIELTALDLPDLTIGLAVSTAKGLSRKRRHRSLNVTAFEKRLKDGHDAGEESQESLSDHSSLSLSSSTSLSLKTPFVDVRTEKRGLQRRVSNRRRITEEEFGAAVNKRQMGGDHEVSVFAPVERGLSQTALSEGFTLGLSQLSEPDITIDIVNSNTALYTQPDAMMSSFSSVAIQDKPTVMASQIQRQITGVEEMDTQLEKEKSVYVFPTEEGVVADTQNEEPEPQLEEKVDTAMSNSEEDEEMEARTEKEIAADSQSQSEELEIVLDSQTEGEEEGAVDSQPEEDVETDSQTEGEQGDAAMSQTEQEEEGEEGVDSQPEEDVEPKSQTEEGQTGAVESQTEEEEDAAGSQSEEEGNSDQEGPAADVAESQTEDEYDGKQQQEEEEEEEVELASGELGCDVEHISRRAHRSEAGLIMPVTGAGGELSDATEAGWSEGRSKAHSAVDLHNSLETRGHESSQLHGEMSPLDEFSTRGQKDASCTEADPDANKENSFHLLQVTHDISGHMSHASPTEAAVEDPAEQEEEDSEDQEDDEEQDVFPCKTPAFVREKRNFFNADPLASPVLKNIQESSTSEALPAAKPKPVRQKKREPAQKEAALPRSYLMNTFKHFAKANVSADVYPVLKDTMDKFFGRLADDLETYAAHAKRKTIEVEDVELLLKRQGYVNDKVPVEVLIEKYLRMDQRKLLIPIATSGNVVNPKKRR